MANVDRPNGFRFVKSLNAAAPNGLLARFEVADNSALTGGTPDHGNVALGDAVKLVSGKVVPMITGNTCLGVVVGVGNGAAVEHGITGPFDPATLEKQYVSAAESATGTWYVWVQLARDSLFEVQSASDLDLTVGANADIAIASTSIAHMDESTSQSTTEITTASNNDVKVFEIPAYEDNDSTLANARYFVKFNTSEF